MHGHRRIGLLAASAALAITTIGAGSAFAAQPYTDSWSGHFVFPAVDCPTYTLWGEFTINHKLTVYLDADGNAIGDLERIDYTGRFFNPDTDASSPDSGTKRFLDTFAADGSYASTIMTFQRIDKYVGEAGRVVLGAQDSNGDQAELRVVGHLGFNDAGVAALCEALAE